MTTPPPVFSMASLAEADDHGRTALMRSIIDNDKDSMVLHASFERGWADVDGYTALMHAVQADNIEAVRLLIDFEYPFTLPDTRTALMLAVEYKRYRLIPLMIERLSRLTDKHGYSALMYAVILGDIEMLRVLLDNWPSSCLEDLLSAKDVVDLGPADGRDAICELLKIAIEKAPTLALLDRRVLCMGVIPKRAIPNHNNGIYPIDVHFHEENATWRETEAQLCETIKLLHAKIEKLESAQLKVAVKRVSRYVSAAQEHKSIGLQTPFDWGNQSWALARLLSRIDSKQRKIAILEEEILTLQGKGGADKADNTYFKEASALRIKERTLKERISVLERAMDEHIGIINSILGKSCQSLMEVESSVKSIAQRDDQAQEKDAPRSLVVDDANVHICSPMTVIQEVSIVATECDKVTGTEAQAVDVSTQATMDNVYASDIASLQRQLGDKEALIDKICSVIEVKGDTNADSQLIVSSLQELLRQRTYLQSELESAREKILEVHATSAQLHNLLVDTGVDSAEALAAHVFNIRQELARYKSCKDNTSSSRPTPVTESDACNTQTNGNLNSSNSVDTTQVPALLRQLSSYTQRPCTSITDAMNLIHEHCVRATSERIALQKLRDDIEREHSLARDARTALANQEAAYNALINKHTLLLNDAQLLAMKYNDLGKKYNSLYADNNQLQEILVSTRQQAMQHQFCKSVRFADSVGPNENVAENENNSRLNENKSKISITIADAVSAQATYEVSADKAGHIKRSISVDDAKKLINQHIIKQKTRSQSTTSGSPLYPAWNCCTSTDISKWLRRPLFV